MVNVKEWTCFELELHLHTYVKYLIFLRINKMWLFEIKDMPIIIQR